MVKKSVNILLPPAEPQWRWLCGAKSCESSHTNDHAHSGTGAGHPTSSEDARLKSLDDAVWRQAGLFIEPEKHQLTRGLPLKAALRG